jgi:hypothetical protein
VETRRDVPSGTPARAPGYVRPADRHRPLRWALGLAAALLVVFAALFVAGRRGVAAPGPVSAAHAAIGSRCAECHAAAHIQPLRLGSGQGLGRSVGQGDLRCERCHDPAASDRLTPASHVGRGTSRTATAHAADAAPCATCHVEHRGRAGLARAVDDRTCVSCHQFPSLSGHPEFAAIKAGAATGIGLKFTHDRHLAEVQKEGGQRCEACHQPTADLSAFEPIDFDRHCASCHTQDGRLTGDTDPLDGRALTPPAAGLPLVTPGARSLVVVTRMAHRDPWVLDNLTRLRRIVDPEGERAERLSLQTRIAVLSSRLQMQPLSAMAAADLALFRDALERDRSGLGAAAPANAQDARALAEMSAAILRVADAVKGAAAPAVESAAAPAAPTEESAGASRAHFDARKAELLALLDAVAARGNPALTARAAALRARVAALAAPASAGTAGDPGGLRERLGALDDILRVVRGLPDQQAASDASAVAAIRDAARQQIGGALPLDQFETRRRELLRALDAIGRQGHASVAGRVAVLRRRVLMLRSGETTIDERRAHTQRMLDRVSLEIELAKGGETAAPSAAAPQRDRRLVEPLIARLVNQLARLEGGNTPAPGPIGSDAAAAALTTLAGPCLKCHVMDGARLAPVPAATRVFRRATFTHKPHLPQADCVSCHRGVSASKLATDVIVPAVATCQSCHTPSKARSDCAACHTYHPAAAGEVAELR